MESPLPASRTHTRSSAWIGPCCPRQLLSSRIHPPRLRRGVPLAKSASVQESRLTTPAVISDTTKIQRSTLAGHSKRKPLRGQIRIARPGGGKRLPVTLAGWSISSERRSTSTSIESRTTAPTRQPANLPARPNRLIRLIRLIRPSHPKRQPSIKRDRRPTPAVNRPTPSRILESASLRNCGNPPIGRSIGQTRRALER
jgi:hypothetical protein